MSDTKYRIWDDQEKTYIYDKRGAEIVEFENAELASTEKDFMLDGGEYPGSPHTVFQIHEFEAGRFSRDVTYGFYGG